MWFDILSQIGDTGDLNVCCFFFNVPSGFPILAVFTLANFWLLIRCCGVCACREGDQHCIYTARVSYLPFWLCVTWSDLGRFPKLI